MIDGEDPDRNVPKFFICIMAKPRNTINI